MMAVNGGRSQSLAGGDGRMVRRCRGLGSRHPQEISRTENSPEKPRSRHHGSSPRGAGDPCAKVTWIGQREERRRIFPQQLTWRAPAAPEAQSGNSGFGIHRGLCEAAKGSRKWWATFLSIDLRLKGLFRGHSCLQSLPLKGVCAST